MGRRFSLNADVLYTQMNSKFGFWRRQLGNKFLVFTRALAIQMVARSRQKILCRFLAKLPTFESICVKRFLLVNPLSF
jgi:hypothetical protein